MTSFLDQQSTAPNGCGCGGQTPLAEEPQAATAASAAAPFGTASGPCCGSRAAADAAGACCDPAAKEQAVAAGASCCG